MVGLFGKGGMQRLPSGCFPAVRSRGFIKLLMHQMRKSPQKPSKKGYEMEATTMQTSRAGYREKWLPGCEKKRGCHCRPGCSSHRLLWEYQQRCRLSSSLDWKGENVELAWFMDECVEGGLLT